MRQQVYIQQHFRRGNAQMAARTGYDRTGHMLRVLLLRSAEPREILPQSASGALLSGRFICLEHHPVLLRGYSERRSRP